MRDISHKAPFGFEQIPLVMKFLAHHKIKGQEEEGRTKNDTQGSNGDGHGIAGMVHLVKGIGRVDFERVNKRLAGVEMGVGERGHPPKVVVGRVVQITVAPCHGLAIDNAIGKGRVLVPNDTVHAVYGDGENIVQGFIQKKNGG